MNVVFNRDSQATAKKPRVGFTGKLVSIATDNAGTLQEFKGEKAENCYTYLDLAVVDETQIQPDGKPTWHNIRLSASKDSPIFMDRHEVLKKCDELIRSGTKPFVRGQYYISTKIPTDENGDPLVKDGKTVVYKNKRMSVADLQVLEILPGPPEVHPAEN